MPLPESPQELETVPFEQLRTLLAWVASELSARVQDTNQQLIGALQTLDRVDQDVGDLQGVRFSPEVMRLVPEASDTTTLPSGWTVTETETFDPEALDRLVLERFQLLDDGVPIDFSSNGLAEHLGLPLDMPLQESTLRLMASGAITHQGGRLVGTTRTILQQAVDAFVLSQAADFEGIPESDEERMDFILEHMRERGTIEGLPASQQVFRLIRRLMQEGRLVCATDGWTVTEPVVADPETIEPDTGVSALESLLEDD